MHISFPYPDIPWLEIPERNLLGVFSPSIVQVEQSEERIIEETLFHPIGSLPLSRMIRGHEKVLVVVDDYTRSTPVQKILPCLIKELEKAGIKKDRIRILVALGTHRPMTEEEMIGKFGQELSRQYSILNHAWWDSSQLIHLGETEKGTPILVNRMVKEVDFIIGVGQIVPHRVSGFSGGCNIIQPGICGEETTGKTHWLSARFRGREILGKIENPVKDEIEQVALKVGLKWIINTIQDGLAEPLMLLPEIRSWPIEGGPLDPSRSIEPNSPVMRISWLWILIPTTPSSGSLQKESMPRNWRSNRMAW